MYVFGKKGKKNVKNGSWNEIVGFKYAITKLLFQTYDGEYLFNISIWPIYSSFRNVILSNFLVWLM